MTLDELLAARDDAQRALNNAMASLAAETPTSAPGGKPNAGDVDHKGTLAELRTTIDHFNQQIAIKRAETGGGVAYASFDT